MKNIEELLNYLPTEYESQAKGSGAMQRVREIKSAKDLMLLCLMYLYKGLSLVEVSIYAGVENIAEISNVNFMKRFAKCGEWFRKIGEELEFAEKVGYNKPSIFDSFRIIAVDASDIVQKGALKLEYHLHYAYDIFNMRTVEYKFTTNKVGETLKNFNTFKSGDIILADRMYGTQTSILHCKESGADYIFRLKHKAFLLYDADGKEIELNEKLSEATETESVDVAAYFKKGKQLIPVNLEDYILDRFAKALANAEEDAFLNGTGTNKPTGIFAATGGGQVGVTAASATAVTSDELLNLVYALNIRRKEKI